MEARDRRLVLKPADVFLPLPSRPARSLPSRQLSLSPLLCGCMERPRSGLGKWQHVQSRLLLPPDKAVAPIAYQLLQPGQAGAPTAVVVVDLIRPASTVESRVQVGDRIVGYADPVGVEIHGWAPMLAGRLVSSGACRL